MTIGSSRVELIRPPMTTIASEWSTSLPVCPAPRANGIRPMAAARALISTGPSRAHEVLVVRQPHDAVAGDDANLGNGFLTQGAEEKRRSEDGCSRGRCRLRGSSRIRTSKKAKARATSVARALDSGGLPAA